MKKNVVILRLSATDESILDESVKDLFATLEPLQGKNDGLDSLKVEALPSLIEDEVRLQVRRFTVENPGSKAMDKLSKLDLSKLVKISIK